jgi:Cu+-exporting ATPase
MKLTLAVKNMYCASCKGNVEKTLKELDGVNSCSVNLITNSAEIDFDEKKVTLDDIFKAGKKIGYPLSVIEDDEYKALKSTHNLLRLILGLVLLVPLMYLSMGAMYPSSLPRFINDYPYISGYLQLVFALAIIAVYFNYYIVGFKGLIHLRPNMESLVFIGSLFSLIYSLYGTILSTINPTIGIHYLYDSSAMILFFVSIGKYIEELSKNKAKSTINELLKLRPKYVNVLRDGKIFQIENKFVQKGDVLIVKPGEVIPLDGLVLSGESFVDESIITGESLPISKKEDDEVIGGSLNKDGTLKIAVSKTKKDSVLNKIIKLIEEASDMKSDLTKKVDKVSSVFVPIVFLVSLVVFFAWLISDLIFGGPQFITYGGVFDEAFTFAIDVLVVSCPCALGLATPISLFVGSSVLSKRGILVNNSSAIENIKYIDSVVLDKTNTLTKGVLSVEEADILTQDRDVIDAIYTIEKYSSHPLSQSISDYLEKRAKLNSNIKETMIVSGKGVKGAYNGGEIYIGNDVLYKEINKNCSGFAKKIDELKGKGFLVIIAFSSEETFALFALKDGIKPESVRFIADIKRLFGRVILATGDNSIIARNVAKELGIDEVISDVKPEDKDAIVRKLQEDGHKVMMIGDGVNDSIALTRADVSLGLAKGSDIALSSSDFILMKNDLMDVLFLLNYSKRIRHNINFNLFWAFIYNLCFVPIAAGAFASLSLILEPMYASILMAISSVTVCLSSLTLFLVKKSDKEAATDSKNKGLSI